MKKYSKRIIIQRFAGFLVLCFLLPLFCASVFSQQLLNDPDMESSAGWNIYHMGSTDTAKYEFNYTTDGPEGGIGGCLKVTSDKRTNILFWQKLVLKGGKSYYTDGLVKTGYVASFWCEVYMSTIAPTENADYAPNNNNDRVWIISTWDGCGPYLNGKFSEVACGGNGTYIAPGNYDEDVDVYYGIKTGIWNDMDEIEVLLDEFSLKLIEDWFLLSTNEGLLDQENLKITDVSPLLSVTDFKSGLRAPLTASVEIIGKASGEIIPGQDSALISDTMMVRVQGNDISLYQIETREIGKGMNIISALNGTVDTINAEVTGLPDNARVIQLKSGISVSPWAMFKITYPDGEVPSAHSIIDSNLIITVSAENGNQKIFTIKTNGTSMEEETVTDSTGIFTEIRNRLLKLEGHIEWHVTVDNNPLPGSLINLVSDNIWIYFDSIRPIEFSNRYLDHLLIGDTNAVVNQNVRLVQYLNGCVVNNQSSDYKPLKIFTEDSLKGNSTDLGIYTYYRSAELGIFDDSIRSCLLKKGYMATMARDEYGTGYSRVFIADSGDLVINRLPEGLYGEVSFIRIFPWRWAHKKGWTSNINSADTLNCSWHYDWSAGGNSSLNVEFIPMRHNAGWDAYSRINEKKNTTHVLAFNEPDHTDQANMTVDAAIAQWPQLLRSGLRLGSPAPSDGGLNWLYSFIDKCDKLNYRVDFVAVHWYQGGQTAGQFYNWLKAVHDRTGRPIWITEWNNGANWTCCKPTYEEQAITIKQFIHMLDTTSFVERYSIYEWVEDTRHIFYSNDPVSFTPAGIVYRDDRSSIAYKPMQAFSINYIPIPYPATNPRPRNSATNIGIDTLLSWSAGDMATVGNIYFGTVNPPPYKTTHADTIFNPGPLDYLTTYYWRVDEVNNQGTVPGTVWQFTTSFPLSAGAPAELEEPTIYPNPASNYIRIPVYNHSGTAILELFDYCGKMVIHEVLKDNGMINIEHLKRGLYIYKVFYSERIYAGKLVVQ